MNQRITKALISFYLKLTRFFGRRLRLPEKSKKYFNLSMIDFSNLINKYEYKSDPLKGALDYIDTPDEFFNENKKSGRDCDDWSRMWSLWGLYHNYRAYEYVICDSSTLKRIFETLHCITVLEKNNKYYLMNYRYYGPYNSLEKALGALCKWKDYSNNPLVVLDREVVLPGK